MASKNASQKAKMTIREERMKSEYNMLRSKLWITGVLETEDTEEKQYNKKMFLYLNKGCILLKEVFL